MFHLNENPENRFSLVSVVILASRSLTTDFLSPALSEIRVLLLMMIVGRGFPWQKGWCLTCTSVGANPEVLTRPLQCS